MGAAIRLLRALLQELLERLVLLALLALLFVLSVEEIEESDFQSWFRTSRSWRVSRTEQTVDDFGHSSAPGIIMLMSSRSMPSWWPTPRDPAAARPAWFPVLTEPSRETVHIAQRSSAETWQEMAARLRPMMGTHEAVARTVTNKFDSVKSEDVLAYLSEITPKKKAKAKTHKEKLEGKTNTKCTAKDTGTGTKYVGYSQYHDLTNKVFVALRRVEKEELWHPAHCAEAGALDLALYDAADPAKLVFNAVDVGESKTSGEAKPPCRNCSQWLEKGSGGYVIKSWFLKELK